MQSQQANGKLAYARARRQLRKLSIGKQSVKPKRFLLIFSLYLLLLVPPIISQIKPVSGFSTIRVPSDFKTIQEAVNSASIGDKIEVAAGTYYEHVVVNKSIGLVGENPATTIIDGMANGTVVRLDASKIIVIGFTIRNAGDSHCAIVSDREVATNDQHEIANNIITTSESGIYLSLSSRNTIENNTFFNNPIAGIFLTESSDNEIARNSISESAYGMRLMYSSSNTIFSNTISQTSYAIHLSEFSTGNTISYNTVSSRTVGVYVSNSDSNTADHNLATECAFGIYFYNSKNAVIRYNILVNNSYGIRLYWASLTTSNHQVTNNRALDNDWAIELVNSNDNTFVGNWLQENTYGAYVSFSASNIFYRNNFIRNIMQVYATAQNFWDKSGEGNYWSDYKGKDADGNGIGDTPYPIIPGYDYYPLMDTWSEHDISIENISLSANKTYVGRTVNITVTVKNKGKIGASETFNVTTKYNSQTVETKKVISLAAGTSMNITFNWNTAGVAAGVNYTVSAEATTVPDELNTDNNNYIDGTITIQEQLTTVSVFPASIIGPPPDINETFVVNITCSNVVNLWSWQAGITFNPDVLEAVSFEEGPFLATGGTTLWEPATINNTLGIVEPYRCTLTLGSTPVSGNGTLASVTFRVKNYGGSPLHLGPDPTEENVILFDSAWTPMPIILEDGYFKLLAFPVASFTFLPLTPYAGKAVTFDASASYDLDGYIVNYSWDFGDGTNATGEIVTHAFTQPRTYTVTLIVTDDDGATDSAVATVTVLSTLRIKPNSAGNFTQWSPYPSQLPNWQCVDEDVQNGGIDYVYVSFKALADSYNLQDTTQSGYILNVRLCTYAKQTIGDEILKQMLVIGGAKYYGAVDYTPATAFTLYYNEWKTNPATGLPWTWSDINSLEAGFESVGVGQFRGEIDVTQLYVEVTYTAKITGDVNGDGTVNASDLSELNKAYGSTSTDLNWNPECDFNKDDVVDASDLFDLAKNYGKTC